MKWLPPNEENKLTEIDYEKYTDPLDVASRNESIATEDSIRNNALASIPYQFPDENGRYAITDCLECGEEIGEGRLKFAIHNHLCVFCQGEIERKQKR